MNSSSPASLPLLSTEYCAKAGIGVQKDERSKYCQNASQINGKFQKRGLEVVFEIDGSMLLTQLSPGP